MALLEKRIEDGVFDDAVVVKDVTTLEPSMLEQHGVRLLKAGWPCQEISVSGTQLGFTGKRSVLFFEVTRLAAAAGIEFLFLENVFGLLGKKMLPTFKAALKELVRIGYQVIYMVLRASEVGAPHARARVCLVSSRPCLSCAC